MGVNILQKNKIIVKEFRNVDTAKTEMALLVFDGKIRDKIIKKFNKQFLIAGCHIKSGGVSSPKTLLSLIGGSATSGQLFMATANPAILKQIENGVGSVVIESSVINGVGSVVLSSFVIIAQARFLSVAKALMPVAASLIAFQALSTTTIMKQFEVVNEKLDKLQDAINSILKRDEVTFAEEIISASNRIDDIENQFSVCHQFTEDMIIRLALLEDKIKPVCERYNNSSALSRDLELKRTDAFMAISTSILDIRIESLKMKLCIQNNPSYMESAAKAFAKKIGFYHDLWTEIQSNSSGIDEVANELKEVLEYQVQFNNQIASAMELGETITNGLIPESKMSLLYWQDELGEHSYYADDLLIKKSSVYENCECKIVTA